MNAQSVYDMLKKRADQAGVKDFSPHDFAERLLATCWIEVWTSRRWRYCRTRQRGHTRRTTAAPKNQEEGGHQAALSVLMQM